jgi:cell division protein FtsA
LAVIPLGGSNITKDIATLQMEESDAEKMKLKYASAYTENNEIDNDLKYSIDPDRQVESRRFIEIVEGRVEEIVENAWYQVPSEYCDKLLGGIVLTGGGANMPKIEKTFQNHTHIEKIRVAKAPICTISGGNDDIKAKNGMMNTVLGLLIKGDVNCAGGEIDPQGTLFPQTPIVTPETNDLRPARKAGEIPAGVVLTELEKQKAEEEARMKREEEERKAREKAEAEAAEAERIRRENSKWNKFKKGVLNFGKKIMEEEE